MLICTKICSSINVSQLHFHIISQLLYVLLQLIYTLLLDHFVSKVQKLTSGFFNSSLTLKCLRKRSPRWISEPSTIPSDFLPSIPKLCHCPDLHHSLCHGTWCWWTSETHVSFTVPWLPKNVVSRCFTLHSWKQTPQTHTQTFQCFFLFVVIFREIFPKMKLKESGFWTLWPKLSITPGSIVDL